MYILIRLLFLIPNVINMHITKKNYIIETIVLCNMFYSVIGRCIHVIYSKF